MRVSLIDASGKVVYDNTLDNVPAGSHRDRPEIRAAIEKGSGFTVRRHSQSTGQTYFYSATRGDGGMVVRTAVPYSVSLSGLLDADKTFIWVTVALTLLFCTLGFSRPQAGTEHLAAGAFRQGRGARREDSRHRPLPA